jgi:hypothetical protein
VMRCSLSVAEQVVVDELGADPVDREREHIDGTRGSLVVDAQS